MRVLDGGEGLKLSQVSPTGYGIDTSARIETFPVRFEMQGPGVFEVTGDTLYLTPVDGSVLLWGPGQAFTLHPGATFAVSGYGGYKIVLPDNSSVNFECGVIRLGAAPFVKTSLKEAADADAKRAADAVSADVKVGVGENLPD